MNTVFAFVLTTIAGLATMLGTIPIFLKRKTDKIIIGSLAFAAGVMITVSLTDLIPKSYYLLKNIYMPFPTILFVLIFIVIGIILSSLIDKYLPDNFEENNTLNKKGLYRVGIISMVAIILHNIPEGIATFMATNVDVSLGISLALAITLHNIPEGISISVPIYYATGSRVKAIMYTFISGTSELFGAVIAYFFLSNFINDKIMGFLFSIIAGIMGHIAIYELLPQSRKYNNKNLTFLFFVIGIIFMIVNHLIFI